MKPHVNMLMTMMMMMRATFLSNSDTEECPFDQILLPAPALASRIKNSDTRLSQLSSAQRCNCMLTGSMAI